uniref:Uncharacterized protein n=1 Tax=Manihot esculenta TaxID=3983 RepID=A0A2C9WG27_MANES
MDSSFCSSAYRVLAGISNCCFPPKSKFYSPIRHWKHYFPSDLHVLNMLPTFILSQDQTSMRFL